MPKLGRTKIHEWFKAATEAERQKLVEFVGISFHYLRSIAYGHRTAGWEVVMRMALGARQVREAGDEEAQKRLPDVQRGDVSPICASCPFYQTCKKAGIREGIKQEGEPTT